MVKLTKSLRSIVDCQIFLELILSFKKKNLETGTLLQGSKEYHCPGLSEYGGLGSPTRN